MGKRVLVNPNDSIDLQPSDIKLLGSKIRFIQEIIEEKEHIKKNELNYSEEILNKFSIKIRKDEIIPENKKVLTRAKNKR